MFPRRTISTFQSYCDNAARLVPPSNPISDIPHDPTATPRPLSSTFAADTHPHRSHRLPPPD